MTKTSRNFMLFIAVFFFLFVPFTSVNAACDYARQVELATYAANVNATYEINEIVLDGNNNIVTDVGPEEVDSVGDYWIVDQVTVSIYNVNDSLFYRVVDDGIGTVYYNDDAVDGVIKFFVDSERIHNLTIEIYSNDSNCSGQLLSSKNITTPKYNAMADSSICFGVDAYYCQKYITTELNMTESEIREQIIQDQLKEEPSEDPEEESQTFDYRIFIIIGVIVLVVAVGVAIVILIRRKRSRVL